MRLIKITVAISALFLNTISVAQSGYSLQEKIYKKAVTYGDLMVAKQALYTMMELKPSNTSLKDSLAILYFQSQAYVQSVLLTNEILTAKPANQTALEIRAISRQNLGLSKESLADYETLHKLTKSPYHLYQIASIQYQIKRMAECEASINQLLIDPKTDKEEISVVVGRGKRQKVPLKAAAMNMKGVLYKEMSKVELAKLQFSEALKLAPDFVLAKGNLTSLSTPAKDEVVKKETATTSSSNTTKKKKKK
ncbi:MAG: tetratricopeptide repeat protein [Cyclobacteriaceae bacterium]